MISYITKYNYREQDEGGERQASSDIMMRVPGVSPVHHNMATWMPLILNSPIEVWTPYSMPGTDLMFIMILLPGTGNLRLFELD